MVPSMVYGRESIATRPGVRGEWLLVLLLFSTLLTLFYFSPVRHVADSRYSMLLSEQLLLHQSFDLSSYFAPHVDSSGYPRVDPKSGWPRHVRARGDRLFYLYPYGSSVLSVPFLAGLRLLGFSAIDDGGRFSAAGEHRIQAVLASLLSALTGLLFYGIARRWMTVGQSLGIALVGSLGSQVWSVTSRVLWSHTWGVLLLSLALFFLLRAERGRSSALLHLPLVATVISWAFFVRPTAVTFIIPVTAYVIWRYRRRSVVFLMTGFLWLAAFVLHSQLVFGQPLPEYYLRGSEQRLESLGIGLLANLVSPGRGLLVYSPWILLCLYLLVRHFSRLCHRGLAIMALVAIVLHVLIVSGNRNWWAGCCYGPRFTTETVPLWVLLAVLAWQAHLETARSERGGSKWRSRLVKVIVALLVLPSLAFHGAPAFSKGWVRWNSSPVPIRRQPMRVFDWQKAQFACALNPDWAARQYRRSAGEVRRAALVDAEDDRSARRLRRSSSSSARSLQRASRPRKNERRRHVGSRRHRGSPQVREPSLTSQPDRTRKEKRGSTFSQVRARKGKCGSSFSQVRARKETCGTTLPRDLARKGKRGSSSSSGCAERSNRGSTSAAGRAREIPGCADVRPPAPRDGARGS